MKLNPRIPVLLLLCALVALEALSATYFVGEERLLYQKWSIPYFICGILIALIPMFRLPRIRQPQQLEHPYLTQALRFFKWGFWAYLSWQLLSAGRQILLQHPMDYMQADMMPIIQVMCQRFIEGKPIYEPIAEIWNNPPIYLPAMWAPYLPFEFIGADIRWGTIVAIIAALWLIMAVWARPKDHSLWMLLAFFPLWHLTKGLWEEQTFLIRFSEEGVVIFHYLFLGYAMYKKNPWLTGLGIALCVLSRYGLLFWVPFFLLFLWFFRSKRAAIITAGTALVLGVLCFLLPYGIEKFQLFTSLPNEYPDFARRLWERDPNFFLTTLGLAKYFSAETVDLQHRLHLVSIFLAPLFMLLAFWQLKKRNIWEGSMWGICSLKLTLTFFYNLIIVPVLYLFWVPGFFSCLLLAVYIRESVKENTDKIGGLA